MQVAVEVSEHLAIVDVVAADQFTIIDQLSQLLYQYNYVKESYRAAIKARELVYPTGLMTGTLGVAIPHTDAEHVLVPAIAVATLAQPVSFSMMGQPEQQVEVNMVFMLAIKDPRCQIAMLQNLTQIFQDASVLARLKQAGNAQILASELGQQINC